MWYFIKVWATTILLTPFVLLVSGSLVRWEIPNPDFFGISFMTVVGLIASIPTFVIIGIVLIYRNLITYSIRLVLSVITVSGIFLTWYFLGGFDINDFTTPLFYAVVMLSSVWFYRLDKLNPQQIQF